MRNKIIHEGNCPKSECVDIIPSDNTTTRCKKKSLLSIERALRIKSLSHFQIVCPTNQNESGNKYYEQIMINGVLNLLGIFFEALSIFGVQKYVFTFTPECKFGM